MNALQNFNEVMNFFLKAMEGDPTCVVDFLDKVKKSINCIRDAMFYKKVSALMNELDNNQSDKRKIGELLAKSNYGIEYGFVLLNYIDDYECTEKGKYLAHLLDSLSKDFISVPDCFIYAKLLKDISLSSLLFIKDNISDRVFKEGIVFKELQRYDLVYAANEGGYAFEYMAYYLDKFALSYCDKKYKYNGEKDHIPSRDKFPAKVASLAITQGEPY